MPNSKKRPDRRVMPKNLLEKRADSENSQPQSTPVQRRKLDALDLAELIYDIFKDDVSNATIKEKD